MLRVAYIALGAVDRALTAAYSSMRAVYGSLGVAHRSLKVAHPTLRVGRHSLRTAHDALSRGHIANLVRSCDIDMGGGRTDCHGGNVQDILVRHQKGALCGQKVWNREGEGCIPQRSRCLNVHTYIVQ